MTERIDHAGEANKILRHAVTSTSKAQVHAILAVAEQARIANLVAMLTEDSSGAVERALVEKVDGKWQLRPDIAAALGLDQS
jgi:HEAT repeat protein